MSAWRNGVGVWIWMLCRGSSKAVSLLPLTLFSILFLRFQSLLRSLLPCFPLPPFFSLSSPKLLSFYTFWSTWRRWSRGRDIPVECRGSWFVLNKFAKIGWLVFTARRSTFGSATTTKWKDIRDWWSRRRYDFSKRTSWRCV